MHIIPASAGPATEKASKSDREWFARNPHRTYRVRRYIQGEFPSENADNIDPAKYELWTLVKQIEPGVRLRLRLAVKSGAEPIDADWVIAPLFNCLFNRTEAGAPEIVDSRSVLGQAIMNAFLPPAHVLRAILEGDVR
jgi:hypothetical protein